MFSFSVVIRLLSQSGTLDLSFLPHFPFLFLCPQAPSADSVRSDLELVQAKTVEYSFPLDI